MPIPRSAAQAKVAAAYTNWGIEDPTEAASTWWTNYLMDSATAPNFDAAFGASARAAIARLTTGGGQQIGGVVNYNPYALNQPTTSPPGPGYNWVAGRGWVKSTGPVPTLGASKSPYSIGTEWGQSAPGLLYNGNQIIPSSQKLGVMNAQTNQLEEPMTAAQLQKSGDKYTIHAVTEQDGTIDYVAFVTPPKKAPTAGDTTGGANPKPFYAAQVDDGGGHFNWVGFPTKAEFDAWLATAMANGDTAMTQGGVLILEPPGTTPSRGGTPTPTPVQNNTTNVTITVNQPTSNVDVTTAVQQGLYHAQLANRGTLPAAQWPANLVVPGTQMGGPS